MKRIVVFALVLNAALLGVIAHQLVALAGGGAVAEINGDTNGDGERDISDATYYLRWLFQGGPEPVAFAGGPDHSEEIAELRASVAALRSDVDSVTAGSASNAAAITTNSTDIASNATAVDELAANPAAGLSDEQSEMLGHMSIRQMLVDDEGNTAKTIRFSGVNVQVVNGTGSTDGDGNGLGNLIVGYNGLRSDDEDDQTDDSNDRSGSHNLVVGNENNYSIFAGQVVGWRNTISGAFSTVSGGYTNTASGNVSTVSGGSLNIAEGDSSTVGGGRDNTASGSRSTVSGGYNNIASGATSTVSGGGNNDAEGVSSTVSGGNSNTASVERSTVSGGQRNRASATHSTVSGGYNNTASGDFSTVSGVRDITASFSNQHLP